MKLSETRQKLVQSIIDALGQGTLMWQRGWSNCPNSFGLAKSLSTSKPYRGANQWILQASAMKLGYSSCWFGTFDQVKRLGGSVKKGSKSIQVCLYKPLKRERIDDKGKLIDDTFMMMKTFNVFNAEQTTLENYKAGFALPTEPAFDRFEKADLLFEATGADLRRGSNRAYYNPVDDYINMPFESQFESQGHWYGTLCHEFIHWSESRIGLDRSKFDESYGFGELVAELGSCLLMNELGIEQTDFDNSCSYLNGWLKKFKSDPSWLFKASSWASKAVDYLLSFSPENVIAEPVEEEIPF